MGVSPHPIRECFTVQSGDFAGAVRAVMADFSSGEWLLRGELLLVFWHIFCSFSFFEDEY